MKVLFIEPPKDIWFVMGEYLPPPFGIIQLAAYLERENKNVQLEILDCNAEKVDWKKMEARIAASNPDVVASASLATCNTYAVVKTLETAKRVVPTTLTVTGGQHFTATANDSLQLYPEIDVIIRNEGEQALAELVKARQQGTGFQDIESISFRNGGKVVHNPSRSLLANLEDLPFPGYHLVKNNMRKYHFSVMSGKRTPYALIEGARGCNHQCTFCTQWCHWQACWRLKSAKRIADEMAYCNQEFESEMIWLTDDNFGSGQRPKEIAEEIITKKLSDVTWFVQARCDDIIRNKDILPSLAKSGLSWVLLGVENSSPAALDYFKKGITPNQAKTAVRLLRDNGIFAHAMVIIGNRKETHQSILQLREFANDLDPDFIMFGILTPFPGTEVYTEAERNGWIEDRNWNHYDMIHAIMPTETLSTHQVQEELYGCYRDFYGSWNRRFQGFFSSNPMKRRTYWHMAMSGVLGKVKSMFQAKTLSQSLSSRFSLPFLVAVSVFGLALVPLFLLLPNLQADPSPFRRPLVSAIYNMVCIVGIFAVFHPGKCRLLFQKPKVSLDDSESSSSAVQFKGHHPDCEKFSANRITIDGSFFCAACSGLLVGAMAALVGIVLFSFGFFDLETGGLWVLVVGDVLMLVGLAQIKMSGFVKMAVNALFVVGSCIILIVADLAGQSFLFDGYVLGLIVFMLWFRIFLSEWNNKRTCVECGRCI